MDKKNVIIIILSVILVIAIAIIITLLPKDEKTVYTISFNTDGGNEVVSQKIEEGKTIKKPVDPSKEGYEFLGWYLDGEYFDFKEKIEEDITLEAKWKEIIVEDNEKEEIEDDENEENKDEKITKYTVKFDSDGGSKVASKTVEKNKTVKAPTDPTKEGYKFLGWYLGNTKYNFSNKVIKNITLKAKWEKVEEKTDEPVTPEVKEYTVTFNSEGGSSVKSQTVKENETVSIPSNPTKDGYIFKGWYLNGTEYSFSSKVTSNITLTAKWEKEDVISYKIEKVSNSVMNQVRVYITLNGEKVAGTADVVNTQGETVKREIPASGWLTFDGTIKTLKNIKVK